jgi:hypothetical protein
MRFLRFTESSPVWLNMDSLATLVADTGSMATANYDMIGKRL